MARGAGGANQGGLMIWIVESAPDVPVAIAAVGWTGVFIPGNMRDLAQPAEQPQGKLRGSFIMGV